MGDNIHNTLATYHTMCGYGSSGDDNFDELCAGLFNSVAQETELLLKNQLNIVKADADSVKRRLYPDDPHTLATYHYDGKLILSVRISKNCMAIEFDTPNLETPGGSND